MANESFAQVSDQARVMALFKAGRSKVEIGREIGKDKKAVGNILAQGIREKANVDPLVERLIDKVREAVGNPDLQVTIIFDHREDKTVIRAGGLDFPFRNAEIGRITFWSVAFARMACVVAEGLKESGNASR